MKSIQTVAALLVAVAAITACGNDDNITDEPNTTTETPKTYTMTVNATMGSDEAMTRALSIDGTGALNATWTAGDEVDVYQAKQALRPGGSMSDYRGYFEKVGTLVAQSSGASTTLTGTVTLSSPANLNLYYGSPSYDYSGQVGTLADIAAKYDYASASLRKSKYTIDGSSIVLNEGVTLNFMNQQAIVKFILLDSSGNAISTDNLTVGATGGYTYNVGYTIANETDDETYNHLSSFTVTSTTATNEFYIAMPKISSSNSAFPISLSAEATDGYNYYYDKDGVTFTSGKYYVISVKMKRYLDLSRLTADYTAVDGEELRGTLPSGIYLTIASGATVTLNGVTISDSGHAGITCEGNATITLVGDNSVTCTSSNNPGIEAGGSGTTLTIQGEGNLTATGGGGAAGIGSSSATCGDITISGGNVTAYGGENGAGIGSGRYGSCGAISISGGNVTAYGGENGAGIGNCDDATYGNITISGGNVTAYGGIYGAGIGSGLETHGNNSCGDITISGGRVTATGGDNSAGIGTGYGRGVTSNCGDIKISGGTVNATAGNETCAGIGSGNEGKFKSLTITDGISSVTATGVVPYSGLNFCYQPIGNGQNGSNSSGTVNVDSNPHWTGEQLPNLKFSYGGVIIGGKQYMRWILTH